MTGPTDSKQPDLHRGNSSGSTEQIAHGALADVGLHEEITGINSADLPVSSDNSFSTFPVDKLKAHTDNIPHVAISVFVFNEHRLLLQKRAITKYHSGGLWANTVCSHPRWGETAPDCANRRMQEELGWTTELFDGDRIDYHAQVGDLYENEYVHCFYGHLTDQSQAASTIGQMGKLSNPVEVADLRWMTLSEIETELSRSPEQFSAWFRIYILSHKNKLQKMMDAASAKV